MQLAHLRRYTYSVLIAIVFLDIAMYVRGQTAGRRDDDETLSTSDH